MYCCTSIYFKTSEKKTPIDPDEISEEIFPSLYTLCIMPRSRLGPGNESHQNKAGGLTLNLFFQFCVLFQVNIILKDI